MGTESGSSKKVRLRSPNYPSLSLKKSMDLAKVLFNTHARHAVPLEVAAKDWSVSAKSSYMAQHVAALLSYGLLEAEGSKTERKLKVSDLAFNIFVDKRPDSQDREMLIRQAALKPDIFKKIYAAHNDELPADHLLEYELVKEYNFNPNSVAEFISILKSTIGFAKVYGSGILASENTVPTEDANMNSSVEISTETPFTQIVQAGTTVTASYPGQHVFPVPFLKGNKAFIAFDRLPVKKGDLEKLKKWIDLFGESLTEQEAESQE